jgi:hypothetical protein
MASWGRKSDELLTGTGSIDANTNIITGANTVFTGEVELLNVVDLNGDRYVVLTIVDDTTLEVAPLGLNTLSNEDALLSEVPKYLTVDQATQEAMYVTISDAQGRIDGVKTPGWTLYSEYLDGTGNRRRKIEPLVAMKQTS